MDPTDDTATKYCTEGVFDTTEGGTPKLIGHSPCLGCDLVLHSCMDPETRDLFICAGNYYMQKERPDTYEGGFITLQWDKEKKAYNKAYIYRALHWQITRVKQKSYRRGIYDTTEAYNVERKKILQRQTHPATALLRRQSELPRFLLRRQARDNLRRPLRHARRRL